MAVFSGEEITVLGSPDIDVIALGHESGGGADTLAE